MLSLSATWANGDKLSTELKSRARQVPCKVSQRRPRSETQLKFINLSTRGEPATGGTLHAAQLPTKRGFGKTKFIWQGMRLTAQMGSPGRPLLFGKTWRWARNDTLVLRLRKCSLVLMAG